MRPRRLFFLLDSLQQGGSQRNVAMLLRHMDRARYDPEVWVLHGGGETLAEIEVSARVVNLDRRAARDPVFAVSAARRIARGGADVIQACQPASAIYAALSGVLFRNPAPLVVSGGTTVEPPLYTLKGAFYRLALRGAATSFVANSEAVRASLEQAGAASGRIRVIPNGHEPEAFDGPFDRQAARAAVGVDGFLRLGVYVGRLIDSKRVRDLLDALALLGKDGSVLGVAIVGDGPERPDLEARSIRLGLAERVRFLGMRRDVREILRSADFFLFPSEVEGLANAVIEAALAGLPIVACDVGGVRDVVRDGAEAVLVPPRKPDAFAVAIRRLMADRACAARLGLAAQRHARSTYDVRAVLSRFYEVWDRAAEEGR